MSLADIRKQLADLWEVVYLLKASGGGGGGTGAVVTLTAPGTYAATAGVTYFFDTTAGNFILNLPVLTTTQSVGVVMANGSTAVHSVTVNAGGAQKLAQPAPNNTNAPTATYVLGGAGATSGSGALDAGTALTWINGGIPNVLNLAA